MPSKTNYKDFSARVKVKYPEYGNMDDLSLAKMWVEQNPQYGEFVVFDEPTPQKKSPVGTTPGQPAGSELVSSGDPIADRAQTQSAIKGYAKNKDKAEEIGYWENLGLNFANGSNNFFNNAFRTAYEGSLAMQGVPAVGIQELSKYNSKPLKEDFRTKTRQDMGLLEESTAAFANSLPIMLSSMGLGLATGVRTMAGKVAGALPSFISGFQESGKEADRIGIKDPLDRLAFQTAGGTIEGVSEFILPDANLVRPLRQRALKDLARIGSKGLSKADVGRYVAEFTEKVAKEVGEEYAVEVGEALRGVSFAVAGYDSAMPEMKSARDYAVMTLSAAIGAGTVGGVGTLADAAYARSTAIKKASENPEAAAQAVADLIEAGKLTEQQGNDFLTKVNLLSRASSRMPKNIDPEVAVNSAELLNQKMDIEEQIKALEEEKKGVDDSFVPEIDTQIASLTEQLNSLTQQISSIRPTEPEGATIELDIPDAVDLSTEDQSVLDIMSSRFEEPYLNAINQRINNAEEISLSELENIAGDMINELTVVSESQDLTDSQKQQLSQLVENQIDNLLNYEFATTTTTEQAGQKTKAAGIISTPREGRPLPESKVSRERFEGAGVRIGGRGAGRITVKPIEGFGGRSVYGISFGNRRGVTPVEDLEFDNLEFVAPVILEDGSFNARMRDSKTGLELTITDPELSIDLAIAESLRQAGKTTFPQPAFLEAFNEVTKGTPTRTTTFPNIGRTGTAPEAAGVQPQTEQDVRQETNVTQERGDEGEASSRLPQEEGRQEGQVTPAVEGEAQASPTAKKKKTAQEKADEQKATLEKLKETLKSLKAKPGGGANIDLTFGVVPITKAVWNTAIDTAILAIDAGQTIAQAVKAASDYISSQIQGDWGKGKFESYMNDQFAVVAGEGVKQKLKLSSNPTLNTFLNELNQIEGIERSPIDPSELIYGETAAITLRPGDNENEIDISSIRSLDKGKGLGRKAMNDINSVADKLGITLKLNAKPFGTTGLSKADLIKFYQKAGFRADLTEYGGEFASEEEMISYVNEFDGESLPMIRLPNIKETEIDVKDVSVKKNEDNDHIVSFKGVEVGKMRYDRSIGFWINADFDRSKEKPYSFKSIYGDTLGDTKDEAISELVSRFNKGLGPKAKKPTTQPDVLKGQFAPSGEFLTIFNASPKELGDLGKRSGVAYFATDEKEAKIYADMNRGKVREFKIKKSDVSTQDVVLDKIKELGLKPKDSKYTIDEALLYELIDDRFDNSLSQSDINRLFNELKKDGVKAFSYDDGGLGAKETTQSVAIIDQKTIVESAVEKAQEKPIAESFANDLEKALNAMKVKVGKGAALEGTFMIPVLVYNGAIDAAILAVKAGKTVVDAINVAVKYVNDNFKGDWDNGGFIGKLSVDLTKPMESYEEYKRVKGKGKEPSPGQKVGVRFNLNIQDYGRRNVLSVHEKNYNGEVIDIVKSSTVSDVKFSASKSGASKIKEGLSNKFPIASVDGSFVSSDADKTLTESGQRVFFNPKVADFFYDKDGREVLSASKATLDGSKVFADGLEYGERLAPINQQQAQPDVLKDVESTTKALEAAKEDDTVTFVAEFINGEEGYRAVSKILDIIDLAQRGDKRGNISIPSAIPFLPKTIKSVHLARNENDKRSILKNGFDEKQSSIDSPIPGIYFSSDDWSDNDRFGRTKKDALYVSIKNEGLVYFDDVASFADYLEENNLPNRGQTLTQEQLNKLKSKGVKGILLREDFASQTRNELIVIDSSIIENISDNEIAVTELPSSFSDSRQISKAYHKAKKDGSNPELVKAVEGLLVGEQQQEKAEKPIAESRREFREKARKYFDGLKKLGFAYDPESNAKEDIAFLKALKDYIKLEIDNGMVTFKGFIEKATALMPEFSNNELKGKAKELWGQAVVKEYPKLMAKYSKVKQQQLEGEIKEIKKDLAGRILKMTSPKAVNVKGQIKTEKRKLSQEAAGQLATIRNAFDMKSMLAMDPKDLLELYNLTTQIYKEGRSDIDALNEELNKQAASQGDAMLDAIASEGKRLQKLKDEATARKKLSLNAGVVIAMNEDERVLLKTEKELDALEGKGYTFMFLNTKGDKYADRNFLMRFFSGRFRSAREIARDLRTALEFIKSPAKSSQDFINSLVEKMNKASVIKARNTKDWSSILKAARNRHFGSDLNFSYTNWMNGVPKVGGNVLEIEDGFGERIQGMTNAKIVTLYRQIMDPRNLVKPKGNEKGPRKINLTDKSIQDIIDYMNLPQNEAGKGFALSLNEFFAQVAKDVSQVLESNGYNADKLKEARYDKDKVNDEFIVKIMDQFVSMRPDGFIPYTPVQATESPDMAQGVEISEDDLLNSTDLQKNFSVISNNMITKKPGGQIVPTDIRQTLNAYTAGMANMSAKLPLLRETQAVFSKRNLTAMNNAFAPQFTENLKANYISYMTDRVVPTSSDKTSAAIKSWLMQSTAIPMFLNFKSGVLQLIATPNFLFSYDFSRYIDSSKELLKSRELYLQTLREIINLPTIKQRYGGRFNPDSRVISDDTNTYGALSIKIPFTNLNISAKELLSKGYAFSSFGDIITIALGGAPVYYDIKKTNKAKYLSEGMSEKDAESKAREDAEEKLYEIIQETQQSSDAMYLSQFQKQSVTRIFASFATATMQYYRKARRASLRMKNGEGNQRQNAYEILHYTVINAAVFQFFSSMLIDAISGPGEDELEEMNRQERMDLVRYMEDVMAAVAQGTGAMGVALQALILGLKESRNTNKPEKIIEAVLRTTPSVRAKYESAVNTIREWKRGDYVKSFAKGGELVNIPADRIRALGLQVSDALTENLEFQERMYRLLGFRTESWMREKKQGEIWDGVQSRIDNSTISERQRAISQTKEDYRSLFKEYGKKYAEAKTESERKRIDSVAAKELVNVYNHRKGGEEFSNELREIASRSIEFYSLPKDLQELKDKNSDKKIETIVNEYIRLEKKDPKKADEYWGLLVTNGIVSKNEIKKIAEEYDTEKGHR